MMRSNKLLVVGAGLLIGLAMVVGDGQPADAATSVVVLKIKGVSSSRLHRTLIDLLSKRFEVVPEWRYRRAARRLHARSLRARNVARVARRLRARVVIYGKVVRRSRRRRALKLNVRSGNNGKLLKRYYIPLRRKRISRRNQRRLRRKLTKLIRNVVAGRMGDTRVRRRTRVASRRDSARKRRRRARARERIQQARERKRLRRERKRARRAKRLRKRRERRARDARERRLERIAKKQRRRARAKRRRARAKRRKAAAKRRRIAREKQEERKAFEIKYDARGNIIDDEIPSVLKKKK